LLSIVFRPARLADAIADSASDVNAALTKVKADPFDKLVTFDGPGLSRIPLLGDSVIYSLHSVMDPASRATRHELLIEVDYRGGSQRRYQSAADNTGAALKLYQFDG